MANSKVIAQVPTGTGLKAEGARRMVFDAKNGPAGDVLVVVFLRGGMDSLHTVPPYADPLYRKHRPTLAPPDPGKPKGIVDLDGFFGLHADLAPMKEIFDSKQLALVTASGSPDSSLSHFEAMQTMERGVADGNSVASGWIARHLASFNADSKSPMRALCLGDVLPKSMQGALTAMQMRSISEYKLQVPDKWGTPFRDALAGLYAVGDDVTHVFGRSTLELMGTLETLDPGKYTPAGGAKYPESELGRGLKQVAQLIKTDIGLEIAEVDLGGWDSHYGQLVAVEGLVKQLGQALPAFAKDMGDGMKRVTLVAMSEFGRRVHENSTFGTDHGAGTVMFVMGGGVRGGKVHGRWPGLGEGQLDKNGNLAVTTDYRDVLAEIVERRVKNPALDKVFPEYKPRYLDLFV